MIWLSFIPIIFWQVLKSFLHDDMWEETFLDHCFFIFILIFFTALISLVPIGIACFIGSMPITNEIKYCEKSLISLTEKDGIKGSFYLGCGMINDQQYYFWYIRENDGSIRGGKTIRSTNVRIYEVDYTPKIVFFRSEYKNKKWNKYLRWIGIDLRTDEYLPDFYIPKGSVKEGYNL